MNCGAHDPTAGTGGRRRRCFLIVVAALSWSAARATSVFGEDLDAWTKRLAPTHPDQHLGVFGARKVLMIDSDHRDVLGPEPAAFGDRGILELVDRRDLQLSINLNKEVGRPAAAPVEVAKQLGLADYLLLAADGDGLTWNLHVDGEPVPHVVRARTPPPLTDIDDLHLWLHERFGYHGVVLDVQGDQLLVGAPAVKHRPGRQGFLLADSAMSGIPRAVGAAVGVVECLQARGRFATYRLLVRGQEREIRRGTKVLLE